MLHCECEGERQQRTLSKKVFACSADRCILGRTHPNVYTRKEASWQGCKVGFILQCLGSERGAKPSIPVGQSLPVR